MPILDVPPMKSPIVSPRFAGKPSVNPVLKLLEKEGTQGTDWQYNNVVTKDGGAIIGQQLSFQLKGASYRLRKIGPTWPQYVDQLGLKSTHTDEFNNKSVVTIEVIRNGKSPVTFSLEATQLDAIMKPLKAHGTAVIASQIATEMVQNAPQGDFWEVKRSSSSAESVYDGATFSVGNTRYRVINASNKFFGVQKYTVAKPSDLHGAFGEVSFPIEKTQYDQLMDQLTPISVPSLVKTYGLGPNLDTTPVLSPLPRKLLEGMISATLSGKPDSAVHGIDPWSQSLSIRMTLPPEYKLNPKRHNITLDITNPNSADKAAYTLSIYREDLPPLVLPLSLPGEKGIADLITRIAKHNSGKQSVASLLQLNQQEFGRLQSQKLDIESKLAKNQESQRLYQDIMDTHFPKSEAELNAEVEALSSPAKPPTP